MICNKCNRDYISLSFPNCKHPEVIKYFGYYICYNCCRKCKYGINGKCEYLDILKSKQVKSIKKPKTKEENQKEDTQINFNTVL